MDMALDNPRVFIYDHLSLPLFRVMVMMMMKRIHLMVMSLRLATQLVALL